jgi:pilus assembly protein Flp/PilA
VVVQLGFGPAFVTSGYRHNWFCHWISSAFQVHGNSKAFSGARLFKIAQSGGRVTDPPVLANRTGSLDDKCKCMFKKLEKARVSRLINLIWKPRIWTDTHGQDLIEYALMAGFVAIAAGAIMPGVSSSISKIFSKISSVMAAAASQS